MQILPSKVLNEIFDAIDGCPHKTSKPNLSKLTDNELAISLFPECREWLEEAHRYDHTPETYISVYFYRTNDLAFQYRMIRYMELRPTKDNKELVNAWYRDLRKKRYASFDNDQPMLLPGVPDYPVFFLRPS